MDNGSAKSSNSASENASDSSSTDQTNSSQPSGAASLSKSSDTSDSDSAGTPASENATVEDHATVAPARLQVTAPITVTTESAQEKTKLGADAVFTIEFNVTGIKTSVKDTVLTIKVPAGTTLAGDLSQYAISGTVPTLENGEIIYKFGNLPAGTTARMVYDF